MDKEVKPSKELDSILAIAKQEALARKHEHVGTGHFLLVYLQKSPKSLLSIHLGQSTLEAVQQALGQGEAPGDKEPELSPHLKELMRRCAREVGVGTPYHSNDTSDYQLYYDAYEEVADIDGLLADICYVATDAQACAKLPAYDGAELALNRFAGAKSSSAWFMRDLCKLSPHELLHESGLSRPWECLRILLVHDRKRFSLSQHLDSLLKRLDYSISQQNDSPFSSAKCLPKVKARLAGLEEKKQALTARLSKVERELALLPQSEVLSSLFEQHRAELAALESEISIANEQCEIEADKTAKELKELRVAQALRIKLVELRRTHREKIDQAVKAAEEEYLKDFEQFLEMNA